MKKDKQSNVWSILLLVTIFLFGFQNICEANSVEKYAIEFINAVKDKDFKKLFNSADRYQTNIEEIKRKYPAAFQQKKIEEYYLEAQKEFIYRSEERRVGKEFSSRWSA